MRRSTNEFPLLEQAGLYAAEIRGDGNCLFNALSDQLYGHQNEHAKIRATVIEYMREHASYYKAFVSFNTGGGTRRNPKRKNAGAYSTQVNNNMPTAEDIERAFEAHLTTMAKGGIWGDNMEIQAFSSAYRVDVKIYQQDLAYVISPSSEDGAREVVHIAYHSWEHFSSIRNLAGPHTGLPQVKEEKSKSLLPQSRHIADWMIELAMSSLPYIANRLMVKRALERHNGDMGATVAFLLAKEERGSISSPSAGGSSSVERELDSEDEAAMTGPNKKQDRRMSKLSRAAQKSQKGPAAKTKASTAASATEEGTGTKGLPQAVSEPAASQLSESSESQPASTSRAARIAGVKEEIESDSSDAEWKEASGKEEDTASEYSDNSRVSWPVKKSVQREASLRRTIQKQPATPRRLISARDRKEKQKREQKEKAKQRKQAAATTGKKSTVPKSTGKQSASPADLELSTGPSKSCGASLPHRYASAIPKRMEKSASHSTHPIKTLYI